MMEALWAFTTACTAAALHARVTVLEANSYCEDACAGLNTSAAAGLWSINRGAGAGTQAPVRYLAAASQYAQVHMK